MYGTVVGYFKPQMSNYTFLGVRRPALTTLRSLRSERERKRQRLRVLKQHAVGEGTSYSSLIVINSFLWARGMLSHDRPVHSKRSAKDRRIRRRRREIRWLTQHVLEHSIQRHCGATDVFHVRVARIAAFVFRRLPVIIVRLETCISVAKEFQEGEGGVRREEACWGKAKSKNSTRMRR